MTDASSAAVHMTDEAKRAALLAKVQARENGIRAKGFQEGRAAERRDILAALGVQRLEEASELARLRAERDERPTPGEEAKHVRGAMGWGMLWGSMIGAAIMCLAIFAMQRVIWDTAARSFREQAMTGAMLSTHQEREPQYGRGQ